MGVLVVLRSPLRWNNKDAQGRGLPVDAEERMAAGLAEVPGVSCSGGAIGIKRNGQHDAALFVCEQPSVMAGVFTTNRFRSACVESALDRLHGGTGVKAVLVTSGNANAGTGAAGRADTELLAASLGELLGCRADEVVVLHTGVIGVPLRAERFVDKLPALAASASSSFAAGLTAAKAMMTTDTFAKTAVTSFEADGIHHKIGGVAKGAGMIHPRLATMISVLATDATVHPVALQAALQRAVKTTFNAISVDGDTSPNDSVILLARSAQFPGAGGQRAASVIREGTQAYESFCTALTEACETLARMIIKDGEGATKFIEIRIEGAATEQDAERVASVVATSPLVKTAFFGEDFNPGRIVSAIGRAGAEFDWSQLRVAIGGEPVFQNDTFLSVPDATARELMAQPELIVDIALGTGACALRFFTCDLTHDYVRINSEYTT